MAGWGKREDFPSAHRAPPRWPAGLQLKPPRRRSPPDRETTVRPLAIEKGGDLETWKHGKEETVRAGAGARVWTNCWTRDGIGGPRPEPES
jgi:hypothetical protein